MRTKVLVARHSLWLIVACLLSVPSRSHGQSYFPLGIGSNWEYQGREGAHERRTVVGTLEIWGTKIHVIRYTESTHNENLENYWTTESDGDVLLWGFFNQREVVGFLYRPAIRILDAPLFIGKTWSSTVEVYTLPDTTLFGTFTYSFAVHEESVITVPAGTFQTFGIGELKYIAPANDHRVSRCTSIEVHAMSSRSSRGLYLGSSGLGMAEAWYARDVGQVQYMADQLYELVSFGLPTSVHPTTWGGVKRHFQRE